MAGYFWWFGINNKDENKSKGHVNFHPYFENFLKGRSMFYDWNRNKSKFQDDYDAIQKNDSILFWMGKGKYPNWGIIGFGIVGEVINQGEKYRLKTSYIPNTPITPYRTDFAKRTKETDFLLKTFGPDFGPLFKVFRQIDDYGEIPGSPIAITIKGITKNQYNKCLDFAQDLNK